MSWRIAGWKGQEMGNYTKAELVEIARTQKMIFWAIVASLLSVVLMFLGSAMVTVVILVRLGLWAFAAYAMFRMATVLRLANPLFWTLGVLIPIPFLGLILLFTATGHATKALQNVG